MYKCLALLLESLEYIASLFAKEISSNFNEMDRARGRSHNKHICIFSWACFDPHMGNTESSNSNFKFAVRTGKENCICSS